MQTLSTRMAWIAIIAIVGIPQAYAQTDLAIGFRQPPDIARPHNWWHWMNGNITREGLTADLEAMKQIGLGGAQIFNVSEGIPLGPIKYMSPEWLTLVKHAATEANRLGIELCMHNCAGWSSSGGPWVTPEFAMQQVTISETAVTGGTKLSAALKQPATNKDYYRDIAVLAFPTPADATTRIKDIKPKAGFEARYGLLPAQDEYPANAIIRRDSILDLTPKLSADGKLDWDAPAGSWTILRIGYTPTGAVNAPSPDSGRGLECDKLSRAGLDAHWNNSMAKVIQELGPLASKTLNNCLIDSYEVGHQNWTKTFRDDFKQRRGYDPLLYLPTLTGRVIDSGEASERFLWDLRRTIADLFADNYYTYFAELCHKNGLQASIEPYDGPFECLLSGRDADIPMGEFWVGGGESNSCKLAASVAHTYGRRIIGAESFTAEPNRGKWQNDPWSLKSVGDLMYTTGINRYIIHRYAHQPWLDKFPGMTMGQWGTHFERTTTWWKQGSAWVQYLWRCQYLLQQGTFAADVCYFAGEATPGDAPFNPALKTAGYDYDACNADVLLRRMTVRDGRLVLPDGMSYRVLVLPDTPYMTPPVLTKLRELVSQGATIIGPKPDRSPSLSDFPDCDATVRKLADEVWANCDGKAVKEHAFGKGRVIWGQDAMAVLAAMNAPADCSITAATGKPKTAWIHRIAGDADVYFVSNQKNRPETLTCTFRVTGKAPELWHADTGEMEPAPVWSERDGRTTIPIDFDPFGSVFVVFRPSSKGANHLVAMKTPLTLPADAPQPKLEIKHAVYEATDGTGSADVTEKLRALVNAGETSIAATNANFGDPTYMHVKRLRVEYSIGGKPVSATVEENGTLELAEAAAPPQPVGPPTVRLRQSQPDKFELLTLLPGAYEFQSAAGKTSKLTVKPGPAPLEIAGPWTLRFPPNWNAPAELTLEKLISWTDHDNEGVHYFSGTAEYQKDFDLKADYLDAGQALYLDLGRVKNIAEVELNGQSLGIWWKPPFAADVTSLVKTGKNTLRVRVTNLWVNRLVGDAQLPDDCDWTGITLKNWPEWLASGKPRPTKRLTFTTWKHYNKDSKPLESGLLGPVTIQSATRIAIGE